MKTIQPTNNKAKWPRHTVESVECRKRDLVVRISDWMNDKDEPAYDIEVYIGGVYDYHESKVCSLRDSTGHRRTRQEVKQDAIEFAQKQIAKLL